MPRHTLQMAHTLLNAAALDLSWLPAGASVSGSVNKGKMKGVAEAHENTPPALSILA